MRVNILNNQVKTFETLPVEFNLESVNGKIKETVFAYTADRVTGNMKPINWKKYNDKWRHLEGINFPALGRRENRQHALCHLDGLVSETTIPVINAVNLEDHNLLTKQKNIIKEQTNY